MKYNTRRLPQINRLFTAHRNSMSSSIVSHYQGRILSAYLVNLHVTAKSVDSLLKKKNVMVEAKILLSSNNSNSSRTIISSNSNHASIQQCPQSVAKRAVSNSQEEARLPEKLQSTIQHTTLTHLSPHYPVRLQRRRVRHCHGDRREDYLILVCLR